MTNFASGLNFSTVIAAGSFAGSVAGNGQRLSRNKV